MVETVETNQPFHFIETPLPIDEAISQWESSAEEDFPPTFLFARDGIVAFSATAYSTKYARIVAFHFRRFSIT